MESEIKRGVVSTTVDKFQCVDVLLDFIKELLLLKNVYTILIISK